MDGNERAIESYKQLEEAACDFHDAIAGTHGSAIILANVPCKEQLEMGGEVQEALLFMAGEPEDLARLIGALMQKNRRFSKLMTETVLTKTLNGLYGKD